MAKSWKKKLREWRDEWHRRKCFTLEDILALDPENAEALRQIAQMDRFELRYKRLIVNSSKVCHFQTEAKKKLTKTCFFVFKNFESKILFQSIFEPNLKLQHVHIYEFVHQKFTGASTVARDTALDVLLNPIAQFGILNYN